MIFMKQARKTQKANLQNEIPVVLDVADVDVNDPIGNHSVNFVFKVKAIESSSPFEYDVDFQMPHPLPRTSKPPKIELSKPETNWSNTSQFLVDEAFISTLKDKKFLYRISFIPRQTVQHGKAPAPKASVKKTEKSSNLYYTFIIDASILLVRGKRFKPTLSVSARCTPPGFKFFEFSVSIDHPLLSDSQIRKFQPLVVFLKHLHQLPNTPLSYQELSESCVGPYLILQPDDPSIPSLITVPGVHECNLKLNIFCIYWGITFKNLKIEVHDRDTEVTD
jgi:hypothetical protein